MAPEPIEPDIRDLAPAAAAHPQRDEGPHSVSQTVRSTALTRPFATRCRRASSVAEPDQASRSYISDGQSAAVPS